MKVLFVASHYEPAWSGGAGRCLSALCRGLARIGTDVSVYTTNADGHGGLLTVQAGEPIDVGGATVTYFPYTWGRPIWASDLLMRKLNESISKFDIIYIASTWQWIGIAVGRLAQKRKVFYVVAPHGSLSSALVKSQKQFKKLLYWYLFSKKYYKHAAAIHFTTEYEKQQSTLLRFKNYSFVVPNCLPPDTLSIYAGEARQKIRKEFHIFPDSPILVTVGRLSPEKRFDLLLESFKLVLKQIPEIYLMTVGIDNNRYAFKMKKLSKRMGLSDRIIWTGYRKGYNLKESYAAADIFLLLSESENFGMAAAEAMAIGIPVIVSNCVGISSDIIAYNAGVVTELESKKIGQAVTNLLRDHSMLKVLGKNAKKAVDELYNDKKVAYSMLKVFENICS